MTKKIACLLVNDSGSCAVEYALTTGLMCLLLLAGLAQLGPKMAHVFELAGCFDRACVLH